MNGSSRFIVGLLINIFFLSGVANAKTDEEVVGEAAAAKISVLLLFISRKSYSSMSIWLAIPSLNMLSQNTNGNLESLNPMALMHLQLLAGTFY